jgi:hypothetical protein
MLRKLVLPMTALILAACGAPAPTPDIDGLATSVAGTLQAAASATAPAATATELPTATAIILPTFTSGPAATTTAQTGNRINLATGATQAVVTGHVNAGQRVSYLAGAAQGQVMLAELSTPSSSAVLEIVGADGNVLLASTTRYTSFRSVLPKTQDYEFRVVGGNSGQDFTLVLTFAVPVRFASGADSASYEGSTVNGYPVTYTVYANKGQDLHVSVDTNPNDAALTIWGFNDGNPYARAQNGVVNFTLDLPESQYYIIEVVPQGGRVIEYEVEIEVN